MIESSREIIEKAIAEVQPCAIVCMISGGKDSMCAYKVAQQLEVPITHIMHGVTGTGIQETTAFVRTFAEGEKPIYIEANAGDAYEQYVNRKGFFGLGMQAHNFAYHILKRQRFVSAISQNIRQRKRNRPVLLITGARASESLNRSKHMLAPHTIDPGNPSNHWLNICHDWSKEDRDKFLESVDAPVNPVTTNLCRSGECLCGTMQSQASREEASFYYPAWGKWLDDLERPAKARWGFGWGENIPKGIKQGKAGQLDLFAPMCVDCLADTPTISD